MGDGYDLGGLPAWLVPAVDRKVRGSTPEFLHACSRFIAALSSEIAELQVTRRHRRGVDGPIVVVQAEHEWFCAHDETGAAYLAEIARYLRENGINVPIVNQNNLYQSVEGEIDTWSGFANLHAIVRQLRVIRPEHPRLVMSLKVGAPDVWGEPRRSEKTAPMVAAALAQVLAAGGQYNVSPFDGGSAPGFSGARRDGHTDWFLTTNRDDCGPITQTGSRGAIHDAVRRVSTFASSFDRLLTALDPDEHHIAVPPDGVAPEILDEETGRTGSGGKRRAGSPNLTVIHASGARGQVAFLFGDPSAPSSHRYQTSLVLSDGSALPVEVPRDLDVAWVLRDTHLVGRSTLDYANVSAFTLVGRILVCFGAPGARAMLSINGSPLEVDVPKGKRPAVEVHEDVVVVICSTEQIDATYVAGDRVLVGVSGLDAEGGPVAHPAFSQVVRIEQSGEATVESAPAAPGAEVGGRVSVVRWLTAGEEENVAGTSVRYARIPGPDSMESLGAPSGYAWLRLRLQNTSTKKARAAMFESADRLHVYDESKLIDVFGAGPGANADPVATLPLRRGEQTLTVLVDNLGRYDAGNALGQPKGLYGHVYEVRNSKAGAAKLVDADLIDPLTFRAPIFGLRYGETTDASRLTWTFAHRKKTPILVSVEPPRPLEEILLLILNDDPVAMVSPGHNLRMVFDAERLRRGNNTFQLAVVGEMAPLVSELKAATSFYEGVASITEKAEWAFAKWEPPSDAAFEEVAKGQLTGRNGSRFKGAPRWWKAELRVPHTERPLVLDASGLSKGQVFLNGRNLCRYFVQTRTGKDVPPQTRYHLPAPYLRVGNEPNELLLFDEHGFPPGKVRVAYE